jgi:hypothetical protein
MWCFRRASGKHLALACLSVCFVASSMSESSNGDKGTIVVVGRRDIEPDQLSAEQVARIYFKQSTSLPAGGPVEPFDLREGSPLYVEFYSRVMGKSPAQVRAYWARQSFSGMGIPPRQFASTAEAIKLVLKTPGAIAYVQKKDLEDGLKVLLDTGK